MFIIGEIIIFQTFVVQYVVINSFIVFFSIYFHYYKNSKKNTLKNVSKLLLLIFISLIINFPWIIFTDQLGSKKGSFISPVGGSYMSYYIINLFSTLLFSLSIIISFILILVLIFFYNDFLKELKKYEFISFFILLSFIANFLIPYLVFFQLNT